MNTSWFLAKAHWVNGSGDACMGLLSNAALVMSMRFHKMGMKKKSGALCLD
jgi:hypothetical protein